MLFAESEAINNSWGYHPVVEDVTRFVRDLQFGDALFLGPGIPDIADHVSAMRLVRSPELTLPSGFYWFGGGGDVRLLVVTGGGAAGQPKMVMNTELAEDDPLVDVLGWFEELWSVAETIARPRFVPHSEVIVKAFGADGFIRNRRCVDGRWTYEVRSDGRVQNLSEHSLDPMPDGDDPEEWVRLEPATSKRFSATLTRAKLYGSFTDTVFSFRATRTLFRPYQFRPVMKLLSTEKMRLLIADEVGLGKTIEAGLIWTELDARQLAHRVLILCPSSLVAKWKREMEERFGYELTELTTGELSNLSSRLEQDRLPRRAAYICSIERMRKWDDLERVSDMKLSFDLAIVDEAHAFRNQGTRSNALGALVSEWARALVFLSATPLNLGNSDLYNLLELLAPGEFGSMDVLEEQLEPNAQLGRIGASLLNSDVTNGQRLAWLRDVRSTTFGAALAARREYAMLAELFSQQELNARDVVRARRLLSSLHALSAVVTRTRKVEIQEDKAVREALEVNVEWSPLERDFYRSFYQWCVERADAVNMPVGFSMQMPLRVASTCIPVAKQMVLGWQAPIVLADPDDPDGEEFKAPSESQLIPPPPELTKLANALDDCDTKYDAFVPAIRNLLQQGRQALIFTFSLPTISYLQRRLSEEFRVAVLNGTVVPAQRHRIIADFRRGDYDIVIANRVASEGLDFEFCSAVVNYDLPWNPMEVEQRIGRIDRIGQREEKIYVVNFHTPGTIESDILERVMARIGVFEHSIGELEPIISSHLRELRELVYDFDLSDAERERRTAEIMTAIEERAMTRSEVENAAPSLLSSDGADIEGLEAALVRQGRYVGQDELALLVEDWAYVSGGSTRREQSGSMLVLTGNAELATQVRALSEARQRSTREVQELVSMLMNETDIALSLNQERSRQEMTQLLTANHPLVRAALDVQSHRQSRFAHIKMGSATMDVTCGQYLVLLAVADWRGLRPSREIWASVRHLRDGAPGPDPLGDAVLSGLASASLQDSATALDGDVLSVTRLAKRELSERWQQDEIVRRSENDALIETRRLSMNSVHERLRSQIDQRIVTLRRDNRSHQVLRLFEGQMRREDERYAAELMRVQDAQSECGMTLEWLAACVVDVI